MPANLREFAEDTAFERYILDHATPLLPTSGSTSVIDLGDAGSTSISVTPQTATATVSVGATDSTGSAGDQLNIDHIRPLLFGAAWKVLDLLVELELERASAPHDQKGKYSIGFKAGKARDGCVRPVLPFDGWPDLWLRVLGTYASTKELRHSLVHRQLRVDQSTGAISEGPQQQGGRAPQALTRDEQSAICQVAVGVAEVVIHRELTTRRADQIRWLVYQLTAHHGQSLFGASPAKGLIPCGHRPAAARPVKRSDARLCGHTCPCACRSRRCVALRSQDPFAR